MARKKADLAEKVKKCLRSRENGKKLYQRADRLLAEIAGEVKPGEMIQLTETRSARLVDRFAEKNIVWTPCGARRWELEVAEA